jgi:hypothetical protein
MTIGYEVSTLSGEQRERLERVFDDLMALAECDVPSVRAATRAAVAHIAQALNGEGMEYELYTNRWSQ